MIAPARRVTAPALMLAIVAATATTFALDAFTPLGLSTWMFYFVALGLCVYSRDDRVPWAVALVATPLTVAGYFISPRIAESVDWMATINRGAGVLLLWLFAAQAAGQIRARREQRIEEWRRRARTTLADQSVEQGSMASFAPRALGFLVDYLGARCGALYVMQPDQTLQRQAELGLAGESPRSYRVGEGLIGQCVSRGVVVMDDLPPDYLRMESATGSAPVSSVAIVPLMADNDWVGALELGFFRRVDQSHVELLADITAPLAAAVRSARWQQERELLLEQTQQQAEELQTQQEELRVSNEELEENSRALRESQARMEAQQTELEETNAQLEAQAALLSRQNEDLTHTRNSLEERRRELQRSNQYKSEFLANMSHELRTPLNSSLILAKLLADNREGNLSGEQVQFAQNIYSAGNELLGLINDILDLSKIEARKVELRRESVEIEGLLESLRQMFRPMAEQKHLRLEIEAETGAPEAIESDGQRLGQILKNLLSNAVKFTDQGHVRLTVRRAGEGTVAFEVQDSGIGIDPDKQSLIFEPFRQGDGTTNRRYGGTGLGLSISRELSEMLGGGISLRSARGQGSTFTLTLPDVLPEQPAEDGESGATPAGTASGAAPAAAGAPVELRRAPRRDLPVAAPLARDDREQVASGDRLLLVVEDDATFARILFELAHEMGFRCLVASTADEGVELALRYAPMAVLLDVGLPDHSGLSVLDRLKHNPATRHIPVQVISAYEQGEAALQMGAAGVAVKPIGRAELSDTIHRLLARSTGGPRRVLVVEDDPLQRDSICRLLALENVVTLSAATGAEALEMLRQHSFDCMVLDLSLPDASGHALLERMASDEAYAFPPVIVYTGRSLSVEEEQQLRRYSKAIVIKGARSPERLLDEVTLFLHQVEAALPPDRRRMLEQARTREAAFDGRRVMIVEDDVRNVFALTRVLEPRGAVLSIARNGREALELLEKGPAPDIVLMDVMMPEMDGLEATRRLRQMPKFARLPVLALTAKAMPDDQQRCLESGANDYITKPIDIDKLLSLMRVWMPK